MFTLQNTISCMHFVFYGAYSTHAYINVCLDDVCAIVWLKDIYIFGRDGIYSRKRRWILGLLSHPPMVPPLSPSGVMGCLSMCILRTLYIYPRMFAQHNVIIYIYISQEKRHFVFLVFHPNLVTSIILHFHYWCMCYHRLSYLKKYINVYLKKMINMFISTWLS